MWRPKEWGNPNEEYHNVCDVPTVQDAEYEAYEAGADAMLEALKKDKHIMTPAQMELLLPDRKYPPRNGYLVFIPDEEK